MQKDLSKKFVKAMNDVSAAQAKLEKALKAFNEIAAFYKLEPC
jgi:hypothetical protein